MSSLTKDIVNVENNRVKSAGSNKIYPLSISETGDKKKPLKATENPEENRENWSGKLDFFLSALSYSVGLGAVWRFPYLCYKNGGGAFLIPFFLFLIFVGVPVMFLELSVGQFASRGPVLSWVMLPLFKGVGISMNIINNYVNIYYIMIIGYSLYYLVLSLNSKLPWEKCNPKWEAKNCIDNFTKPYFNYIADCYNETTKITYDKCEANGQCYDRSLNNNMMFAFDNKTCFNATYSDKYRVGWYDPTFPSQVFWNERILKKSDTISDTGTLVWELVIALFVAWVICFFCLFRGVKLSGKIVYFTALFPYLVLFILGIRGWILPGAIEGIKFYIIPDWSKLTEASVWTDAAVQVFFTLSLSYGGLIALSSYNKFNHNILRDTLVLSASNFLTCILAGFVVFAYMGVLSKETGLPIEKVVQPGQGLVYVVYPYAATTIPAGPVWSVMFFLMMLALGMGTMMASVETLTTSLEDFFPYLKSNGKIKAVTLAIICTLYFLIGLLLCSQAGTYWIELFDEYSANWAILLIAIAECASVAVYGLDRFEIDVSTMLQPGSSLNRNLFYWWKICWLFITPALLVALSLFSWIKAAPLSGFPGWTEIVGNILSATSLSGIIGWAIYEIVRGFKNGTPLNDLIKPSKEWRPLLDQNHDKVKQQYELKPFINQPKRFGNFFQKSFKSSF